MASASGGLLDALWGKSNARWLSSDVHHPRRATVCLGTRIIHYTDHCCTLLLLRYYYYKVALWPIIIRNKRTRTKHVVQQWFSTLHIFFFSFPVGLVFGRAQRFTKSCSSQRLRIRKGISWYETRVYIRSYFIIFHAFVTIPEYKTYTEPHFMNRSPLLPLVIAK